MPVRNVKVHSVESAFGVHFSARPGASSSVPGLKLIRVSSIYEVMTIPLVFIESSEEGSPE